MEVFLRVYWDKTEISVPASQDTHLVCHMMTDLTPFSAVSEWKGALCKGDESAAGKERAFRTEKKRIVSSEVSRIV